MIALTNGAEGGSNGTTVTTGNSGGASGNPWDSLNGTVTFTTTQAAHGSLSYSCNNGTGVATAVNWSATSTGGAATTIYWRAYIFITANPAVAQPLVIIKNNSATQAYRLDLSTTGKLVQRDTASTTLTTSTASVALSTWTRLEGKLIMSTTAGQTTLSFYTRDAISPVETPNASGAAVNTAGGTIGNVAIGQPSSSGTNAGYTVLVDDVGFSDTAALGPADVRPTAQLMNA